jgi:hypothetical protein
MLWTNDLMKIEWFQQKKNILNINIYKTAWEVIDKVITYIFIYKYIYTHTVYITIFTYVLNYIHDYKNVENLINYWYHNYLPYLIQKPDLKVKLIHDRHIHDLILKFYVFLLGVISLTSDKLMPVPCMSDRKNKESEYNFRI